MFGVSRMLRGPGCGVARPGTIFRASELDSWEATRATKDGSKVEASAMFRRDRAAG